MRKQRFKFQIGGSLRQTLTPIDILKQRYSKEFLDWWFTSPEISKWMREVEGEDNQNARGRHLYNIDKDTHYDYEKAWRAGERPKINQRDNRHHWSSVGKGKYHPTAWMETHLQKTGINPDSLSDQQRKVLPLKYLPKNNIQSKGFVFKNGGMFLLDHKGIPQMKMQGGEIIWSRKDTANIVSAAMKADDDDGLLELGKIVHAARKKHHNRENKS